MVGTSAGGTFGDTADEIHVTVPVSIVGTPDDERSQASSEKTQALKREFREAIDHRVVELQRPGGLLYKG